MMDEPIWFKKYQLNDSSPFVRPILMAHLGLVLVKLGDDCLVGTMPVDHCTTQPAGLLHGAVRLGVLVSN